MCYLKIAARFAIASAIIGCSSSSKTLSIDARADSSVPTSDVGFPIATDTDGGSDAFSPAPDLALPSEWTNDSPIEVSSGPDVRLDVSSDVSGAYDASACYWPTASSYSLRHFRFTLTTPDGQTQSPPKIDTHVDAGGWAIHDFEGKVVSKIGNQLNVDSCVASASCQPSNYHFVLCDSLAGNCSADSSPVAITAAVPRDRRVRIVWHLDNDVPGFCPGLYFLVIYDAELGATQGNILFVGSGGRQESGSGTASTPLQSLPFSVTTRALGCGQEKAAAIFEPDDYAFVFTSNATSASLHLATGDSGSLTLPSPTGGTQQLQFHCLDAVQPDHTDDYWNWDFWASDDVVSALPDAGSADHGLGTSE
jgi:hypothetical protein